MNKLEKIDYINMLAQMTLKARIADDVYEPNGSHYDYAPTQSEIDEHRANLGAFREVLV